MNLNEVLVIISDVKANREKLKQKKDGDGLLYCYQLNLGSFGVLL